MNGSRQQTIPILAYHQVEKIGKGPVSRPGLIVDAKSFDRQMTVLRSLGYRSIGLDELTGALAGNRALPEKPVVLTFDDGYAGAYEFAFPILQKHGFTSVLFLIAEDFAGNGRAAVRRAFPVLTRKQVAEMLACGFGVGSHSLSHPRLTALSDLELQREVTLSKQILEDAFGPVDAFCYPNGLYDSRLKAEISRAGYSCACSTRFGRSHRPEDRFSLKRISVGSAQGLAAFVYRLLWARDETGSDPS